MGRVAVRTAVQAATQAAQLPYVGTVYLARPVVMNEEDYTQTMNGLATQESVNGSSCVVVVSMPSDIRTRFADVGRGAVADFNKHIIALELFFASVEGDGVESQLDYDLIVDSLFTFIRQNPTMSAPASVWSAGEYTYGVRHEQSEAYTDQDGTVVFINGLVKFEAWEQDNGSFQ